MIDACALPALTSFHPYDLHPSPFTHGLPIEPRQSTFWLNESFRAVRTQPFAYTGVVVFSLLASGLLFEPAHCRMLLASLWMLRGDLTGRRRTRRTFGQNARVRRSRKAFSDRKLRNQFFTIGILSAIWLEIVSAVFAILGRESLEKWKITAEGVDLESIYANFPTTALVVAFALYVPLLMLTTFSPLLIALNKQPVGKSLFFSFFGVLRNLGPIVLYLVVLLVGATVVTLAVEAFFAAIGLPAAVAFTAPILMCFLSALSQAGVWAMFRDFFGSTRVEG